MSEYKDLLKETAELTKQKNITELEIDLMVHKLAKEIIPIAIVFKTTFNEDTQTEIIENDLEKLLNYGISLLNTAINNSQFIEDKINIYKSLLRTLSDLIEGIKDKFKNVINERSYSEIMKEVEETE